MLLKFDEFVKLNEGVESVIPLSDVRKIIEPHGWVYSKGKSDSFKFTKGKHVIYGHLKHGNSKDENRKVDVNALDILRGYLIDDFLNTGEMTLLKEIPWDEWRLNPSPFDKELKDYDPETGQKKEKKVELNTGQKLNQKKIEKNIKDANELYKDSALWRIDNDDENSAYIITHTNERGKVLYNTCRSSDDRRPILKNWTMDYKEENGSYYFGKDDMRIFRTKFYKVLSNGELDKKEVVELRESKNFQNNC